MALQSNNLRRIVTIALSLAFAPFAFSQNPPVIGVNLPTAQFYAKFAWARQGSILGDLPEGPIFADTRGDQSEFWSKAYRGKVGWVYQPGEKVPRIALVLSLPGKQPYQAEGSLAGYDREQNAYVQISNDGLHAGTVVCRVDPDGNVVVVAQLPSGLSRDLVGRTKISAEKPDTTKGLILGDERIDQNQQLVMAQGKVSWSYQHPEPEPDEIRVVLIEKNGNVRSPHAALRGFDQEKNAYVQITSDISEFNGHYYQIDNTGMPTKIVELPKNLWKPREKRQEAQSAPPAPPDPKSPVEKLPNGKFKVTFMDPDSNQPASAEMEQLAASKDPHNPLDGVYHNEKYMVMIRGGEVRVSPNRVPMGFTRPQRPSQ